MSDLITDCGITFERFEGRSPALYLDPSGFVTVGVGHMLPSDKAASDLFGCDMSIQFAQVKACSPGHLAAYYAQFTTARLTDTQITKERDADIENAIVSLRIRLHFFDGLPYGIKRALVDMAANLGAAKLVKTYPKLTALLQAKPLDLAAISDQSKRGAEFLNPDGSKTFREVNPARNMEITNLILSSGATA